MSAVSADQIELTPAQNAELLRLARAGTTTQRLALRISIILLAAQGRPNTAIADRLSICCDTAAKWRHRWWAAPDLSRLGSARRSGRPPN
jgi:DNA-binding NarL/FixJ family response regulator